MIITNLSDALAARESAKQAGDRVAYQAAAALCGELTRAAKSAEPPSAILSAEIDAYNARQISADRLAGLRKKIDRIAGQWVRGQEWPRLGDGLPTNWVAMIPANLRAELGADEIINEIGEGI